MDILNIISNVCSIIGLFVSLFLTSKVIKLSHITFGNNTEAIMGSELDVAKNSSVIAAPNSVVDYKVINSSGNNIENNAWRYQVLNNYSYKIYDNLKNINIMGK